MERFGSPRLRRAILTFAVLTAPMLGGGREGVAQESCTAVRPGFAPSVETARALCALVDEAHASNSDALLVTRGGEPVVEWYGDEGPRRIQLMSITTPIAALAIGRLILDGRLEGLDTPLSTWFPEWRQGRKADVTLRHVLTHTTGLQNVQNAGLEIEPAPDAVQLALAAELDDEPGAAFSYNNKAVNLVSGVVHRITGQPIDEYLGVTVFRDLGITDVEWVTDPSGTPYAMAGLALTARDLARIGDLLLGGGRLDGVPLIDPDWARESVRSQHELYPNHGFLWFLFGGASALPDGFYADGWLGQRMVVIPDARLVAVRLIDREAWRSERDSFEGFRDIVRALAADW